MLMRGRVSARVNLTADRLLLLEMENKYLNVFPPSHCPMRRTTRTEQEIMDSLDACVDSDELLNKMIVKVQDALERVVSFIKIHGSSTTLSRMQLRRLQRYRNQLHGDNFISVFTCPICSIKSITFIGLWKHMSGLHNIYLRAKGMLSTIIAKDTFITPRKLIIKRKRVNATQADGAGVSETVRRMLRKIRRKVTTLTTSTEAPTMPMVERKRKMAHDVVGEIMQKWAMRHAMGQNETMRINKDVQKEWQRFRHMG
ncbi:hypothetical protein M8J76_005455 [Diaphorina citri]|nr:hypothetical protein M8J76_005455 [Diaphorina citri]